MGILDRCKEASGSLSTKSDEDRAVSCGNNLSRAPVVAVWFGPGEGILVASQLLTAGRLARRLMDADWRVAHYDSAAEQFVLNLLARALDR